MNKKRGLLFLGLEFGLAAAALICFALSIFQDGNQTLLLTGLMCNSIAFVINCIVNRKKK